MSATPGVNKPSLTGLVFRIIKLGISIFGISARLVWQRAGLVIGRRQAGTGVVLYYHSVPERYRAQFAEQMKMVASQTRPIALGGLNSLPQDTHSVAITFDDGLESFVHNAVPVLEELSIPATVFAVADAFGARPAWGESYFGPEERVMSAEQLRELPALISVGSHTLTHPNLASLSSEASAREITESRNKLEALLRRPITTFSFPHGEFNDSCVAECREAGYERVFTTVPTLLRGDQNEYLVGRVAADPWDWRLEFKLKMLGAYCWQPYFKSAKNRIKRMISGTEAAKTVGLEVSNRPTVQPASARRTN